MALEGATGLGAGEGAGDTWPELLIEGWLTAGCSISVLAFIDVGCGPLLAAAATVLVLSIIVKPVDCDSSLDFFFFEEFLWIRGFLCVAMVNDEEREAKEAGGGGLLAELPVGDAGRLVGDEGEKAVGDNVLDFLRGVLFCFFVGLWNLTKSCSCSSENEIVPGVLGSKCAFPIPTSIKSFGTLSVVCILCRFTSKNLLMIKWHP
jgi:hypothetical protein